jgi:hypothetical protein
MEQFYKVELMEAGTPWHTYLEADNAKQAADFARIEADAPHASATVRVAVYGEWDCSRFTLAGHTPHGNFHTDGDR